MRSLKEYFTPLAVVALAAVVLYDHLTLRGPTVPEPTVNGVALGRKYAPALTGAYAAGWLAAAAAIETGKTVEDAQKVLQDTWRDERVKAFAAEVQPGFAVVLPEGTEPTDAARRAQVAQLWRAFAKGLKGGW